MAFHDPIDAISWALEVQHKLLLLPWPEELLTHADAKDAHMPGLVTEKGLLFRGLRVRMALHTGLPDALQVSSLRPATHILVLNFALKPHMRDGFCFGTWPHPLLCLDAHMPASDKASHDMFALTHHTCGVPSNYSQAGYSHT